MGVRGRLAWRRTTLLECGVGNTGDQGEPWSPVEKKEIVHSPKN